MFTKSCFHHRFIAWCVLASASVMLGCQSDHSAYEGFTVLPAPYMANGQAFSRSASGGLIINQSDPNPRKEVRVRSYGSYEELEQEHGLKGHSEIKAIIIDKIAAYLKLDTGKHEITKLSNLSLLVPDDITQIKPRTELNTVVARLAVGTIHKNTNVEENAGAGETVKESIKKEEVVDLFSEVSGNYTEKVSGKGLIVAERSWKVVNNHHVPYGLGTKGLSRYVGEIRSLGYPSGYPDLDKSRRRHKYCFEIAVAHQQDPSEHYTIPYCPGKQHFKDDFFIDPAYDPVHKHDTKRGMAVPGLARLEGEDELFGPFSKKRFRLTYPILFVEKLTVDFQTNDPGRQGVDDFVQVATAAYDIWITESIWILEER